MPLLNTLLVEINETHPAALAQRVPLVNMQQARHYFMYV